MRLATLAALCLLAAAASVAQTPDPNPPETYYPLGVGDVREYRASGSASSPGPRYSLRETVLGDTLAGGVGYRLVERLYLESGQPLIRSRHPVRFDTSAARPLERQPDGSETPLSICRLDLDSDSSPAECPVSASGMDEVVQIGTDVVTRPVRIVGHFGATETYASGIGFVRRDYETSEYVEQITYARVAGVAYGTPDPFLPPLATDGGPSAFALTAGPNPAAGPLALGVTLASPSVVMVEAFDALGRRVHRTTATLGAGAQTLGVDAAAWAPGVYVVRVTAGEASATVRVVRR